MNATPDKTATPPKKKTPLNSSWIATGAMFLIVVLFWRDLKTTKAQQQLLGEKNKQLEQQLSTANEELDFFKTGDFSKVAKDTATKAKPVAPKPVEEMETLFLHQPTVQQTDSGLVARFQFAPETDVPLPDNITLVVRIPNGSNARILSLEPSSSSHSITAHAINASGKLAMIEGSPADLAALEFVLTVTEPVTALVRGSEGIKDFEIDISPDGCSVRKL